MMIWAFNKVDDEEERELVYQSIKSGKSRFGWSQKDEHNLKLKDNWTDWHSKQLFLLQVITGINKYEGTAGMIITTAKKTEALENKIKEASEKIGRPIDLLASDDVAKFVIKYAPELLFKLEGIS